LKTGTGKREMMFIACLGLNRSSGGGNMDIEHERLELLDAVRNLAALIECATDISDIFHYVDQLSELKASLVALRPPASKKKTAAES
jgi:hypothetical protein